MPLLTLASVLFYMGLMLALTLIVRFEYIRIHRRDWRGPKRKDLERGIRFPYSPPPERRQRAFDLPSKLTPIKLPRCS